MDAWNTSFTIQLTQGVRRKRQRIPDEERPVQRVPEPEVSLVGLKQTDSSEEKADSCEKLPPSNIAAQPRGKSASDHMRDIEESRKDFESIFNSTKGGFRDNLTLQQIRTLKHIFQKADEDHSGGLEMDEFVKAFGEVLVPIPTDGKQQPLSEEEAERIRVREMQRLFRKIDADSDGQVDWNEFSSFILLENQNAFTIKAAPRQTATLERQCRRYPNPPNALHNRFVHSLVYIPPRDMYFTASEDGTLRLWAAGSLQHRHTVIHSQPWPTAAVFMSAVDKIAVAAIDRKITFYDAYSMEEGRGCIVTSHLPLTLGYCGAGERNLLLVGDDEGCVSLYEDPTEHVRWSDSLLQYRPKKQPGLSLSTDVDGEGSLLRDSLRSRALHSLEKKIRMRSPSPHRLHDDRVTRVMYLAKLASSLVISSSLDKTLCVSDIERHFSSMASDGSSAFSVKLVGHQRGVLSFDFCETRNLVASGGLDKVVLLWNPFTSRPMARLSGHLTAVVSVVSNNSDDRIFTMAADGVVKLWDLRTHRCIQSLTVYQNTPTSLSLTRSHDSEERGGRVTVRSYDAGTMIYNSMHDHLVIARREPISYALCRPAMETVAMRSHTAPVVRALYHSDFEQVASADIDGGLAVWDFITGEKLSGVSRLHGNAELTTIAFDCTGRRLLTAGRDCKVRAWNFHTGKVLKTFLKRDNAEVTELLSIALSSETRSEKQLVVGVGWNKKVVLWRDRKREPRVDSFEEFAEAPDDLLSADFSEPTTLAAGCADGSIIVWNIESGIPRFRLSVTTPVAGDTTYIPKRLDELAIEKVVFLQRSTWSTPSHETTALHGVLLSAGADGFLRFWHTLEGRPLGGFHAGHAPGEAVTALCVDSSATRLFTGDAAGVVKAWDMARLCGELGKRMAATTGTIPSAVLLELVCERHVWRAHIARICCINYAEAHSVVITASEDGTVRLWSVDARQTPGDAGTEAAKRVMLIGTLGQTRLWNVTKPDTYTTELPPELKSAPPVDSWASRATARTKSAKTRPAGDKTEGEGGRGDRKKGDGNEVEDIHVEEEEEDDDDDEEFEESPLVRSIFTASQKARMPTPSGTVSERVRGGSAKSKSQVKLQGTLTTTHIRLTQSEERKPRYLSTTESRGEISTAVSKQTTRASLKKHILAKSQ